MKPSRKRSVERKAGEPDTDEAGVAPLPTPALEVGSLVERFASGVDREESFRQLFRRYYRLLIWHFSRRGATTAEAEDLAQETFFAVYRGLDGFRGASSFDRWLLGIADNIHRSNLRGSRALKRAHQEVPLDAVEPRQMEGTLEAPSTPLEAAVGAERLAALDAAIREFPTQMRRCAALRFRQGLEYQEIATVLQISLDAVKVQLSRARSRLRERFENPG